MIKNPVVDYINNNFNDQEKEALLAGLSPSDKAAIASANLGAMSEPLRKVFQDRELMVRAKNMPTSATAQFGANHPFLGHIAADFGQAGTNISNALRSLVGASQDNTNYYNAYGVKENPVDDLSTALITTGATAPAGEFAAAKAAESIPMLGSDVAKLMAGGATSGAALEPNDPLSGAISGASMAGAGGYAVQGVGDLAKAALKAGLTKVAQQGLTKQVANSIINRVRSGKSLAEALQDEYNGRMNNFDVSRGKAEEIASDKTIPIKSDAYKNTLQKFVDSSESMTPAELDNNKYALDYAQQALDANNIPQNLSDVMLKSQVLNREADGFLRTKYNRLLSEDKPTFDLIKNLKGSLKDVLSDSATGDNKQAIDEFTQHFNDSNKHYADAMRVANAPSDTLANEAQSSSLLQALKENRASGSTLQDISAQNLAKPYLTKGTRGFATLQDILGDKQASNVAAKQFIENAGATEAGVSKVNPRVLVSAYNKMPTELQRSLFTDDERNIMDALVKSKADYAEFPNSLGNKVISVLTALSPSLAGAGLGAAGGYKAGGMEGALLGGAAGAAAGFGGGKLLTKPDFLRNLYQENAKNSLLKDIFLRSGAYSVPTIKGAITNGN